MGDTFLDSPFASSGSELVSAASVRAGIGAVRSFKSTPKGFPKSGSVLSYDHYLTGSVISTNLLDIERVFPVGSLDLLTLQFEPLTTLGESDVIAN